MKVNQHIKIVLILLFINTLACKSTSSDQSPVENRIIKPSHYKVCLRKGLHRLNKLVNGAYKGIDSEENNTTSIDTETFEQNYLTVTSPYKVSTEHHFSNKEGQLIDSRTISSLSIHYRNLFTPNGEIFFITPEPNPKPEFSSTGNILYQQLKKHLITDSNFDLKKIHFTCENDPEILDLFKEIIKRKNITEKEIYTFDIYSEEGLTLFGSSKATIVYNFLSNHYEQIENKKLGSISVYNLKKSNKEEVIDFNLCFNLK